MKAMNHAELPLAHQAVTPAQRILEERARVLARDVSIARSRPADSSVLNILPSRIESVRDDDGTMLLRLALSDADAAGDGPRLRSAATCATVG